MGSTPFDSQAGQVRSSAVDTPMAEPEGLCTLALLDLVWEESTRLAPMDPCRDEVHLPYRQHYRYPYRCRHSADPWGLSTELAAPATDSLLPLTAA